MSRWREPAVGSRSRTRPALAQLACSAPTRPPVAASGVQIAISHTATFRPTGAVLAAPVRNCSRACSQAARGSSAWSAGCSDGVRLYSLGMLLERLGALERSLTSAVIYSKRTSQWRKSQSLRRRFGCCAGTRAFRTAGLNGRTGRRPGAGDSSCAATSRSTWGRPLARGSTRPSPTAAMARRGIPPARPQRAADRPGRPRAARDRPARVRAGGPHDQGARSWAPSAWWRSSSR